MTFENIINDTNCNCIENSFEDTNNEYIRKLKKDKIEDKDFITHWERIIGRDSQICKDVCSYKSISIDLCQDNNIGIITNKYKITFHINPKKGAYYIKFKFDENAGKIVHTNDKNDITHHEFYKSDEFTLGKIKIINTVKYA